MAGHPARPFWILLLALASMALAILTLGGAVFAFGAAQLTPPPPAIGELESVPTSTAPPPTATSPVTATLIGPTGEELDYTLAPNFGSLALSNGFAPELYLVGVTSGGSVDVAGLSLGPDCVGYATSAPDVRLQWSGPGDLRIFFVPRRAGGDATLIVNTPTAGWACNDDWPGGSLSPLIDLPGALSGQYDIWVGSYQPGAFIDGTLYVTQRYDLNPLNVLQTGPTPTRAAGITATPTRIGVTPTPTGISITLTPGDGTTPTPIVGGITPSPDRASTAAALDAQAAADSATATAAPLPTAVAMVTREFQIIDQSGEELGMGQVRVFAPARLELDEVGEIRVEIVVNAAAIAEVTTGPGTPLPPLTPLGGTLIPEPSATPAGEPGEPTPTPLPLAGADLIIVREFMGASLRGPDIRNFNVDPVPPSGLRHLRADAVNWWKWNITPADEESLGVNYLEIAIYLPMVRDDGTEFNEETSNIPLQIEVVRRGGWLSTVAGALTAIASAIVALGGAAGTLYGAYRFVSDRLRWAGRRGAPPAPEGEEERGEGVSLEVRGDVAGQLTVAGDDVITYQTVIQQMPVPLIVGVIAGLVAMVVALGVIVLVVLSSM